MLLSTNGLPLIMTNPIADRHGRKPLMASNGNIALPGGSFAVRDLGLIPGSTPNVKMATRRTLVPERVLPGMDTTFAPSGPFSSSVARGRTPVTLLCTAWRAMSRMSSASAADARPPYPCRPLGAAATTDDASPNRWRATELIDAVHRNGSGATLLLPLHELTATYWEAHVGIGRDGRQADCTHFCPSPFMWERFWWALRQHV